MQPVSQGHGTRDRTCGVVRCGVECVASLVSSVVLLASGENGEQGEMRQAGVQGSRLYSHPGT